MTVPCDNWHYVARAPPAEHIHKPDQLRAPQLKDKVGVIDAVRKGEHVVIRRPTDPPPIRVSAFFVIRWWVGPEGENNWDAASENCEEETLRIGRVTACHMVQSHDTVTWSRTSLRLDEVGGE